MTGAQLRALAANLRSRAPVPTATQGIGEHATSVAVHSVASALEEAAGDADQVVADHDQSESSRVFTKSIIVRATREEVQALDDMVQDLRASGRVATRSSLVRMLVRQGLNSPKEHR